ncbi:hypothetical protein N825_25285 [Skermanella stibiiresistens SB22]|uniref:Peptidase S24/S26A/S26B/S26C domain-containing protein n=1 Tax=Skermanella stibiiresistens SB22 TaxID=1385369 RepID=W9GS87_9PROT|nr:S24 family peptidase [Skermanella stibiiresistens]EWY36750.1 hypothetical protein N825_25285 [Skermanella stibiiresistens SB22]
MELAGVADPWATFVPDDSMEPKYSAGDKVIVHPNRLPTPGKPIVVLDMENQAIIRLFVKLTEGQLTVRQLTPDQEYEIPIDGIQGIYRICGSIEL